MNLVYLPIAVHVERTTFRNVRTFSFTNRRPSDVHGFGFVNRQRNPCNVSARSLFAGGPPLSRDAWFSVRAFAGVQIRVRVKPPPPPPPTGPAEGTRDKRRGRNGERCTYVGRRRAHVLHGFQRATVVSYRCSESHATKRPVFLPTPTRSAVNRVSRDVPPNTSGYGSGGAARE